MAGDLRLIGIHHPKDLIGKDPFQLYDELYGMSGKKHILVLLMCLCRLSILWKVAIHCLGGHLQMRERKLVKFRGKLKGLGVKSALDSY